MFSSRYISNSKEESKLAPWERPVLVEDCEKSWPRMVRRGYGHKGMDKRAEKSNTLGFFRTPCLLKKEWTTQKCSPWARLVQIFSLCLDVVCSTWLLNWNSRSTRSLRSLVLNLRTLECSTETNGAALALSSPPTTPRLVTPSLVSRVYVHLRFTSNSLLSAERIA